jgi:hypothetical protein
MTVESASKGKADVGVIGFDTAHIEGNQLLIFPRSLKPFAGTRVVGIKFDQIERPAPLEPAKRQLPNPRTRKSQTPSRQLTKTAKEKEQGEAITSSGNSGRSDVRRPPTKQRRAPTSPLDRETKPAGSTLKHEILAALEEMRRGESVAAYERLKRLVDE